MLYTIDAYEYILFYFIFILLDYLHHERRYLFGFGLPAAVGCGLSVPGLVGGTRLEPRCPSIRVDTSRRRYPPSSRMLCKTFLLGHRDQFQPMCIGIHLHINWMYLCSTIIDLER